MLDLGLWRELRAELEESDGHPIVAAALRQETERAHEQLVAELQDVLDRVEQALGFDELYRILVIEADPNDRPGEFLSRIADALERHARQTAEVNA